MATGRIQVEVIREGAIVETKAFVGDVIEIGKLSRSHLRLMDENVSRKHARIEVDREGRVQLVDLASTNGTRLNGMRVNKAFLSDGDEIEIGLTQLRVRFDADLQKAAVAHAKSARTELSREGFYRTEEAARGGRLALEGALLWEDSPIQVDSFVRRSALSALGTMLGGLVLLAGAAAVAYVALVLDLDIKLVGALMIPAPIALFFGLCMAVFGLYLVLPFRMRALLLLLFALSPLPLWSAAALLAFVFQHPDLAIGTGAAGLGLATYFLMDLDGWRSLVTTSLWKLGRGQDVYVGETHQCAFFLPSERIGSTQYPLLKPVSRGLWGLNLRHSEIRGDVLQGGKVLTVAEARTKGLVKGDLLPMEPGTKARLRFGQFSMLLSYVPVPEKPKGGFISSINVTELAYMAASLIIHFGLLILFVYLQPEDDIQIRRGENTLLARMVQVESTMAKEKPEEKEEKEEEEAKRPEEKDEKLDLEEPGMQDTDPKIVEEEPKFVERQKPKTALDRAEQKQQNMHLARKTSERYIPTQMLATITGGSVLRRPDSGLGIKIIGGGPGGDGPVESGVFASEVAGTGGGYAGLDNFGSTQGFGDIGDHQGGMHGGLIAGLDKEKAGPGGRFGKVQFKDTKQKAIVTTGTVNVSGGALTRAIIKKYIDRQKGSIILCYKREVQKNPDLEGKVVVQFTIAPTGTVLGPGILSSTLGNASVESCIVQRLALFRFPAPQNAGAVRVSYPFLFRTK